jgi:hypothetical protein
MDADYPIITNCYGHPIFVEKKHVLIFFIRHSHTFIQQSYTFVIKFTEINHLI